MACRHHIPVRLRHVVRLHGRRIMRWQQCASLVPRHYYMRFHVFWILREWWHGQYRRSSSQIHLADSLRYRGAPPRAGRRQGVWGHGVGVVQL
jgi:hypothetical protein